MFETFEVKNTYVITTGNLILYASGRTTGLVVDSGDGYSQTFPAVDGILIEPAVGQMEIGGRVMTKYLQKLLIENTDDSFTSSFVNETVKDIKEEVCYVASKYEEELAQAVNSSELDKPYILPDKRVINISRSLQMKCPELLFKPQLDGKSCKSLPDLIWQTVKSSDIDLRKDLCKNVILSGGSTMYQGLPDRLLEEIVVFTPAGTEIKVVASSDRKFAVWKGGSTMTTLQSFESSWISVDDYKEHGASIVHQKCTLSGNI